MNEAGVSVDDVWRAHRRLRSMLPPTPLVYSERCAAYLKLENLQVTGAFKVRGASMLWPANVNAATIGL